MSDGTHLSWEFRKRAVEAVQQGIPVGQVAVAYGVSRVTVFRWTRRIDSDGEQGLQRRSGSGRPRKLEELTEEELHMAHSNKFATQHRKKMPRIRLGLLAMDCSFRRVSCLSSICVLA